MNRHWTNVLFDFDGTLVDSGPLHAAAYRAVLACHEPDLAASFDYSRVAGMTTAEGFLHLGVSADRVAELSAEKQAAFRHAVADGQLVPLPGARNLLAALTAASHRLFLVTSGSCTSVTAALSAAGLAPAFAGIVTADDVAAGKPAPDCYQLCLSRFGLSVDRSVVVEDAPVGVVAARGAGLFVLGVHNPAIADLADIFFPTLTALERWAQDAMALEGAS